MLLWDKVIYKILILIVIVSGQEGFAQSSTAKDFMPLKVGCKWKYSFYSSWYSSMSRGYGTDTGTVSLTVTQKIEESNRILWNIFKKRDYDYSSYVSYTSYSGHSQDSTTFQLIEMKDGNHQLYLLSFDGTSIFPFPNFSGKEILPFNGSNTDSIKFYRYYDSLSTRTFIKNSNYSTYNDKYKINVTMKADTGVIKTITSESSTSGTYSSNARYHFLAKYDSLAQLSIPTKICSISILARTYKDTAIKIINESLKTLAISKVSSSDPSFLILNYPSTISPEGQGVITIRFCPSTVGTSSAVISIDCNSYGTENKIYFTGNAYEKVIMSLNPSNTLNFGYCYNNSIKTNAVIISNKGNIPLFIDSIKINNPAFTSKYNKLTINAGQSIADSIIFSPKKTAKYSYVMSIYSNSAKSPDNIYLEAISFEELKVELNQYYFSIGKVETGRSKDTAIVITNRGYESIYVSAYVKMKDYGINYISPVTIVSPDLTFFYEIKPNTSIREVIRFIPKDNAGFTTTIVNNYAPAIYQNTVKTDSIRVAGNMDSNLYQNYPNPFNSTTRIKFYLSSNSYVTLKIYDILGREIKTLANEQMQAGIYERLFNAQGLASGVYFYRLSTNDFKMTKKILLVK
jgi:hypothetical protein